jgi:DNA topoisomerase VI subunit B
MKNLFAALIKFQKNVKPIPKNKVNPFYNSKYAELSTVIDVCQPALNDAGLAVIQTMKILPESSDNVLVTMLCHESGETLESNIFLPKIADAQKLTGAVTYLRRTSYLSILGLVADDDMDGNDVAEPKKEVSIPKKPDQPKPAFQVEGIGQQRPMTGLASDAQKNALKKMGVKFNDDISKQEASELIAQNNKRN